MRDETFTDEHTERILVEMWHSKCSEKVATHAFERRCTVKKKNQTNCTIYIHMQVVHPEYSRRIEIIIMNSFFNCVNTHDIDEKNIAYTYSNYNYNNKKQTSELAALYMNRYEH